MGSTASCGPELRQKAYRSRTMRLQNFHASRHVPPWLRCWLEQALDLVAPRRVPLRQRCGLRVIATNDRGLARRWGSRVVLIVDTSAVIEVLTAAAPDQTLVERLSSDGDLHAPHLLDVEVLQVLRGLVRAGTLSSDRAEDARLDFADLAIIRYPHEALADRAWQLRENVTAYDAVFLALAEFTGAPLITCDRRLARAPDVTAAVEVFDTSNQ